MGKIKYFEYRFYENDTGKTLENCERNNKRVHDKGDIYRGEYVGKYSVSEETFVPENQLVDGKYMGKGSYWRKETSYFFKIIKIWKCTVGTYWKKNPDFIKPEGKKNEVIAFIKQGLQDLSISRTTFDWGIPLELEKGI